MSNIEPERGFVEPQTDKQIVVYRGGWGFRLPDQHTVRVNEVDGLVDVSMPQRGGTYTLERVEETDEEYRVHVAGPVGRTAGMPLATSPLSIRSRPSTMSSSACVVHGSMRDSARPTSTPGRKVPAGTPTRRRSVGDSVWRRKASESHPSGFGQLRNYGRTCSYMPD